MSAQPDGTVTAVSRNETYSFSKPGREEIRLIAGLGVEGDAHAGAHVRHQGRVRADPTQPNLRQVHLIHAELFDQVWAEGFDVRPGQLGENVTTSGVDLLALPRGTILRFRPSGFGGQDRPSGFGGQDRPSGFGGQDRPDGDRFGAEAIGELLAVAGRATLAEPARNAVAALVEAAGRAGPSGVTTVVVTGLRNPCGQINTFRPGLLKRVVGHDADGKLVRRGGVMAVVLHGGPIRPGDSVLVDPPPQPHQPLEPV